MTVKRRRQDLRRRHDIPTGRPPGPPLGSYNALKTGARTEAWVQLRKAFAELMREANRVLRAGP
jgi:hypothetical protein